MKKTENASACERLFAIAKKNIVALEDRKDLESQMSDSADFIETSVWSLEKLIQEVYELGRADGAKEGK